MINLTTFGLSPSLLERLRKVRTQPTGGIWYWLPTPEGWDMLGYTAAGELTVDSPSDPLANVFHKAEFEDVVSRMAKAWGLDSLPLNRDSYQGIPRGRVSRNSDGVWQFEHGGEFSTQHIKRLFGLSNEPVQEAVIEHETTNPGHVEVVGQTLLYKTGNDARIVRVFEAIKGHKAIISSRPSQSASTQISMEIEAKHSSRRHDSDLAQ